MNPWDEVDLCFDIADIMFDAQLTAEALGLVAAAMRAGDALVDGAGLEGDAP